jgi:hypothetical protein
MQVVEVAGAVKVSALHPLQAELQLPEEETVVLTQTQALPALLIRVGVAAVAAAIVMAVHILLFMADTVVQVL